VGAGWNRAALMCMKHCMQDKAGGTGCVSHASRPGRRHVWLQYWNRI